MKQTQEYCYSPLYGMLVQRRVTPQQYVAVTQLYGTMYPYGLNDRLQHVGNVSHSYVRSRNNVFNLFNRHQRCKWSHGWRSNSRRNSEITLDQLRNLYNGGQSHGGLHRLRTTLHSARLSNLHKLLDECERLIVANQEQRFRSIVLDMCCKRFFFPYGQVLTPQLNLHDASSKSLSRTKG